MLTGNKGQAGNVQAERLNPESLKRHAIVQPTIERRGGSRNVYPPYLYGIQVILQIDAKMSFYGTYVAINEQVTLQNQDPVLNEAAIRLGVSLRQTEDQLTSNMLAATAAFINCVGGFNGMIN